MSQTEKQAQMEFMEGQALAIELQKHMAGKFNAVIGNALGLATGTFCMTYGGDPQQMLAAIANVAWHHMQNFNPTPVPKNEVN
jgi:hypothetical protein